MSMINIKRNTYDKLPLAQGHIFLGPDNRYYLNVKGQITDIDNYVRSMIIERHLKHETPALNDLIPEWRKKIYDVFKHTRVVKIRDDGFCIRLTLGKMMAIVSFDTNNTYRVEILDGNSREDVAFFVMDDFNMCVKWIFQKMGIVFNVGVDMVEVS